jgi:hypothetical protein
MDENSENKKQYSPSNERGWNIKSWQEFRQAEETMKPKSKLHNTVKAEMKKRGNWRNAPHGKYPQSK